MSVARQLYKLQEIDLEIEADERSLSQIISRLGESQAVARAKARLDLEHQRLEELKQQQHSVEWEIDDLVNKLTMAEERLYGGRISNPKELANLQHEVDGWKVKRDHLEDKVLEIMDQVELATTSVAAVSSELGALEAGWQSQQQRLQADVEQLKAVLSDLKHKRELLSAEIDSQAVEFYDELRKQKGQAVAKVEKNICGSCRILLPTTELQQAKSGGLVKCNSCGRILCPE